MTIFTKLYSKDKKQALKDILQEYHKKGFLIVNYLYFANLVSNGIIGGKKINKDFLNAISFGDFLLPDGIALKLYYKKYFQIDSNNINGTDFSNYLFQNLDKNDFNLILYGSEKEVIKKASENIEKKYNLKVSYFQDGFSEFNFEVLKTLPKGKINIFMVGLGTPKQEIWVKNNIDNIRKYNLLTFTQGGTFDFWAGNEKRAPKIFINLKLEWLWRFITNPKKNFKKVWYSFYLFYFLAKKK
ncbi:MAG: WecB/TagA/CpsF family glycosyltransferase [Candidatus Gracilibacteria bacterium]|nr:WecB/TagA/CpsF family glycosyltransferase [Candidatus Gracilibacteria bacterium]